MKFEEVFAAYKDDEKIEYFDKDEKVWILLPPFHIGIQSYLPWPPPKIFYSDFRIKPHENMEKGDYLMVCGGGLRNENGT